jgi:hypothetical protein
MRGDASRKIFHGYFMPTGKIVACAVLSDIAGFAARPHRFGRVEQASLGWDDDEIGPADRIRPCSRTR